MEIFLDNIFVFSETLRLEFFCFLETLRLEFFFTISTDFFSATMLIEIIFWGTLLIIFFF